MDNIDFGAIVTMLANMYLPALILVVVSFLGIQVRKVIALATDFIQAHLDAKQQELLSQFVKEGVYAAEQIANRPDVKNAAGLKRDMAFNYINTRAKQHNMSLTAEQVYSLIENAVLAEFNKKTA